jgi:hypothetical protein
MRGQVNTVARADSTIDLYWLPLGAGGQFVSWNGRAYEALMALWERRRPQDLYHSALEVTVPQSRFTSRPPAGGRAPGWKTCTRLEGRPGCCETTAAQADITRNPRISGVLSALRVSRTLGA